MQLSRISSGWPTASDRHRQGVTKVLRRSRSGHSIPSLRSNVWAPVLPVRGVSALPDHGCRGGGRGVSALLGHGCRGGGRLSSAALYLLRLRPSLAGKGAHLTERHAHDLGQVGRLGVRLDTSQLGPGSGRAVLWLAPFELGSGWLVWLTSRKTGLGPSLAFARSRSSSVQLASLIGDGEDR
jgi:hypothetical protein